MSALDVWQELLDRAIRLRGLLPSQNMARVRKDDTRSAASELALRYLQVVRSQIEVVAADEIAGLDEAFQGLLKLASSSAQALSYKKRLREIEKLRPVVSAKLALDATRPEDKISISAEDQRIARTLEGIVPSAARSFKQALLDLTNTKRVSYRGPAVELREALRETLDALAPDGEVIQMDGYKQEKDLKGPTMKQKVRFILRAREMKDTAAPEQAVSAVEEIVGGFARSVYTMSNAGTHGIKERADVMRIRRYVTIVMHDILALPE